MANTEQTVCRNIRECRRVCRRTQEDLALEADVSVSHLSKIERGLSSPTVRTLERLAQAMQVPIEAFFRGADVTES